MNERRFQIEKWTVQPDQNLIASPEDQAAIEPKTMDVLVYLIERQGQTVTREEFVEAVWNGAFVTENTLNQAISKLRKVFNDEAQKPRVIETVSKRGYRLIAPVRRLSETETPRLPIFGSPLVRISVAAIGLALAGLWFYRAAGTPQKNFEIRIFSAAEGLERHPSFSRNGDRVAYVYGNVCKNESEIRIQSVTTDFIESFARIPGFKKFPKFSSDDKHLIFWNESGSPVRSTLYMLTPPDSVLVTLLEIPMAIRGLDWSPDQRWIVYSAKSDTSRTSFCLYLFDREEKRVRPITFPELSSTNDRFPVFSPDGRSLAFQREMGEFDFDVWIMDLETRNIKRLTDDKTLISGLAWAGDDAVIYSQLFEGDGFKIVKIDTRTSAREVLSKTDGPCSFLDARRNKIVFQTNTLSVSVTKFNLISQNRSILFNSNYQETFPEYSPSGKYFAFNSNRTGPYQLWVGDISGEQTRKISSLKLSTLSSQARWSPNEEFLYVDAPYKEKVGIYRVSVNDGTAALLIRDASRPTLSVDGKFIYFNTVRSGSSQIWKASIDGGDPVQVTFQGGLIGFENATDSAFYFIKDHENGIWRKKGGREQLVFDGVADTEISNWCLFQNRIYYAKRFGMIWSYDLRTGASQQVLETGPATCGIVFGLSLDAEGKSILFSHDERSESDLKIIEYE